ncbi:MAG: Flp pilus assembly protein CpaB [Fuerstiella sp.]|nr:Flp pilus assembly protein CpaB [Fuerstiella sp.]
MKNQTLILLLVAGACGLVAMLGVKQHLSKNSGGNEEAQTIQVLVAASSITPGDLLGELNTVFSTVNIHTCPEGVVTDLAQIEERSLKVARVAGDYIFVDQLTEPGQTGASAVIPSGMRVKTIPVDANNTHSGMLRPGNRIDLLLSDSHRDPGTGQQIRRVRPLLQYIEVFAVGAEVYGVNSGTGNTQQARNISLLVTPQQMMVLELADTKGEISTVLRSSADQEQISMNGMTEDDLEVGDPGVVNSTSTLDVAEGLGGFALPPEEPANIVAQLENEFGPVRSEPLVQDDAEEFWTMAIYESGIVRVEKVNLNSDVSIETSLQQLPVNGASKSSSPQGGLPSAPVDGLEGLGKGRLDEGALDEGALDEGALEELTSGLLDLFN